MLGPAGSIGSSSSKEVPSPHIHGHQGPKWKLPQKKAAGNDSPAAGQQSGAEGSSQKASTSQASASSSVFASAGKPLKAGGAREASRQGVDSNEGARPSVFKDKQQEAVKALQEAPKIYVAGFSSQGGGHTDRMLAPLGEAVKPGEVVVLVLPPHWQVDSGNEGKKLDKYKELYESKGAEVLTVQSDKAILGFYKDEGPSDNFAILQEFANKPKRDLSSIVQFGPKRDANDQLQITTGEGFRHHDIMENIVSAIGADEVKKKVQVFEDMDPYLAKAAKDAGVPEDKILGQSNHLLLIEKTDHPAFEGKSDAFLVKANGNGHIGEVSTVNFDASVNSTKLLGESLKGDLKVSPADNALETRKRMLDILLSDQAKRYDLTSDAAVPISGCVMYEKDADAKSIDRGVYIYLNKYTAPLGEYIKEKLLTDNPDDPIANAYKKTMFVVCGADTLPGKLNAMHVAQAANFDGVTSAGFGTSSEMHYLYSNEAYEGKWLVMPVEDQHEQQINAEVLLPEALGEKKDKLALAKTIDDLKTQLDNMVMGATVDSDLKGKTMESLFEATNKAVDTPKVVGQLRDGTPMTEPESNLLGRNKERAEAPETKTLRRLNKVMIPVLDALEKGNPSVNLRMTEKSGSKWASIPQVIHSLRDKTLAAQLLQYSGASDDKAFAECKEVADALESAFRLRPAERKETLAKVKADWVAKFHLGY